MTETPTDALNGNEPGEQADSGAPAATETVEPQPFPSTSAQPWLPSPPQIHAYKDPDAVAEAAAKRFLDSAKRAVEKSDRFRVVLAGGSTPGRLYRRLTESPYREKVPWDKTLFVFGDERCVPPDDENSNYRMVRENLLAPLEIPEHHVLRMKGEQPPADAARRYEVRLTDLFLGRPKRKFDLILLGIGTDGHTASLFPGTTALDEQERWVIENQVPQLDTWRLTLTLKALNSTRRVIFLATGEDKAQVIAEAFGGVEHASPHPCERVTPYNARREILIDHAAAGRIPDKSSDSDEPAT